MGVYSIRKFVIFFILFPACSQQFELSLQKQITDSSSSNPTGTQNNKNEPGEGFVWVGLGSDPNWDTDTNWSGGRPPGPKDTAIFDPKACSINCSPEIKKSTHVQGITLKSGYTGTINQNQNVSVTLGSDHTWTYRQEGGTYKRGSSIIKIIPGQKFILQNGPRLIFTDETGQVVGYIGFTSDHGLTIFSREFEDALRNYDAYSLNFRPLVIDGGLEQKSYLMETFVSIKEDKNKVYLPGFCIGKALFFWAPSGRNPASGCGVNDSKVLGGLTVINY